MKTKKGITSITTNEGDKIIFPKAFVFTKQDWEDLYNTLSSFKARVMLRHKAAKDLLEGEAIELSDNNEGGK